MGHFDETCISSYSPLSLTIVILNKGVHSFYNMTIIKQTPELYHIERMKFWPKECIYILLTFSFYGTYHNSHV